MVPTYRDLQKYIKQFLITGSLRKSYHELAIELLLANVGRYRYLHDEYPIEYVKKLSRNQLLDIVNREKIRPIGRTKKALLETFNKIANFDSLIAEKDKISGILSNLVNSESQNILKRDLLKVKKLREAYFSQVKPSETIAVSDKKKHEDKNIKVDSGIVLKYPDELTVNPKYNRIKDDFDKLTKNIKLPCYIRPFLVEYVENTNGGITRTVLTSTKSKYILINNRKELDSYASELSSIATRNGGKSLVDYDIFNNKQAQVDAYLAKKDEVKIGRKPSYSIRLDVQIYNPTNAVSEIIRVANSPDENCLLRIIRLLHPTKLDKLYKKFPELKTQKYVNQQEIEKIAKYIRLCIRVYTPLGANIDNIWNQFGYPNDKVLSVVITNEHAVMKTNLSDISDVRYVSKISDLDDINIIHLEWDYIVEKGEIVDREIFYAVRLDDSKLIVEKTFRPSTITGNPDDDKEPRYFRCYKPDQVLYKIFSKDNMRPITDDNINKIVIAAEHFIGRRIIKPLPAVCTEVDHNRNYSSYETLPEYIGFPETTLIPSKVPSSPAFVIINNINSPPEFLRELYEYKSGKIVLPYPVYKYLTDYCDIDVDYYLNAKFRHISLYDFVKKYDTKHEKLFVNSAIGRSIAGGIDATKRVSFEIKNDNELQQVINECSAINIEFSLVNGLFTAYIPKRPNGDFCFHSYILGYAALHLFKKWKQYNVLGFNVDALIVEGKHTEYSSEIGGWKTGPVKQFFRHMEPAGILQKETVLPDILVTNRYIDLDPIIIVGAAGVSKTFTEINDPVYSQIIATPRIELRDALKQYFPNTHTGQKLFQPAVDDNAFYSHIIKRIPRSYGYLVLDEVGMYSRDDHEKILKRVPKGTVLRYLYDPAQIHNSITSDPVDLQYFIDKGFKVQYITRTHATRARHSYTYGCKLDKLRDTGDITGFAHSNDVGNSDIIITGNHLRAKELNDRYKSQFQLFPVRDRKRRYKFLPVDDPSIYWDKKTMSDDIPKGYTYLPALAITPDSIQGRTITDQKVFVDYNYLKRQGTLYVAMTRTTEEELTFLYDDEPSRD